MKEWDALGGVIRPVKSVAHDEFGAAYGDGCGTVPGDWCRDALIGNN